jgi:transcriptional regulator with XRE-family HTH domain
MATARQPETIGERIKRLRLERALSQRDVEAPGVSFAYVSRIESGHRLPSVKALRKLARALGVTPEYLETGADLRPDEVLALRLADAELAARLGEVHGDDLETASAAVARAAEDLADGELAASGRIAGARIASSSERFADAIELLEGALRTGSVSPVVQPQVFVMLANCYRSLGRVREAAETLTRALDDVRGLPPDDLSRARLAGALSEILEEFGELEEARTLRTAAATAGAADPYARTRALWTLARGPELEKRPREKLRRLREALFLLESTENTLELARAQLAFARSALFGDRPETAEAYLEAAGLLFARGAEPEDRGSLLAHRALYEAYQGNRDNAEQLARDASELLVEHAAEQAPAWFAAGIAAAQSGDVDGASSAFAAAVEGLEAANRRRDAAKVCRAWSTTLRQAGRLEEALDVAERAATLAAKA